MAPFEPPSTSQSSLTSSRSRRTSEHLHPSDAVYLNSPPRKTARQRSPLGRSDTVTTASAGISEARKQRSKKRGRSSSRRRNNGATHRPAQWKKLLWVKQSYPDNYTDEETFLDHLQRNPSLRPYEFWPLVADSMVIVQHVCSVVIFVCCFTGIHEQRVAPETVVGWATLGTVAGWVVRDYWQGKEEAEAAEAEAEAEKARGETAKVEAEDDEKESLASTAGSVDATLLGLKEGAFTSAPPIAANMATPAVSRAHSRNPSANSTSFPPANPPSYADGLDLETIVPRSNAYIPPWDGAPSAFSPRTQERLATAKSALLIYCSLLGLSPILKSLTKSTTPDSIWALSSWLMGINVFTFDYGAGPEAKFPASLSTNAALMASTVLASRLPSTTHVFSLTLFSIEVFGLFPVFRRHLRAKSWTGHVYLTAALVASSGWSLAIIVSGGGYGWGIFGAVVGALVTAMAMGLCSWWLIGLQRYKNEIHGPWDPARPVIRRHWD
ncbi:hypothetical protein MBLNU230_g3149t1 [Neophaeotheca triangularis]